MSKHLSSLQIQPTSERAPLRQRFPERLKRRSTAPDNVTARVPGAGTSVTLVGGLVLKHDLDLGLAGRTDQVGRLGSMANPDAIGIYSIDGWCGVWFTSRCPICRLLTIEP